MGIVAAEMASAMLDESASCDEGRPSSKDMYIPTMQVVR